MAPGETLNHQASRTPQDPIQRVPTRKEGNDGHSATAELREQSADAQMTGVDHLAAPQISHSLGPQPEGQVDETEIEIDLGVEELLPRCGLA